jgi:serine/threonine protein kinase
MEPPSDDARLTHEQVAEGGAHHIHEICNPTIYPAANGRELASMTLNSRREGAIVLARSQGASQAYVLTHSPEHAIPLYLSLGGLRQQQERGRIYFAVLCPAIGNNVFEVPQVRQEVAIKVLNKLVIQEYLNRRPDGENPYKEIACMEEIGDNVHVLKHIEALEDERHLYIVMPKGAESLDNYVKGKMGKGQDIPPARCHEIFCKIIQICAYLLENNINHHDLSPDNLLFLTEKNLVLMDFQSNPSQSRYETPHTHCASHWGICLWETWMDGCNCLCRSPWL